MIILPPEWETYIEAHNMPLLPLLDELERETHWRTPYPQMLSGKIQAAVLHFLVRLTGAQRILEVGTFTGYATLAMAQALPDSGKIITLEHNAETLDIARRYFERSGLDGKIHVRQGDALETLQKIDGTFDLIFLDADKERYPQYYPLLKKLLAPGALWITDNVLWSGKVLDPSDGQARGIAAFNKLAANDPAIEQVILPLRDGLMLLRKR